MTHLTTLINTALLPVLTKPGFVHFSALNLLWTSREGHQDKPTGFITLSGLITSRTSPELFQHPRLCPKHILEPNKVKKTTESFCFVKQVLSVLLAIGVNRDAFAVTLYRLSNEFISNTVKIKRKTDDDENGFLHPVTDVHGSNIHNRERSTSLSQNTIIQFKGASVASVYSRPHKNIPLCSYMLLVLGEEVVNLRSRLLRLF